MTQKDIYEILSHNYEKVIVKMEVNIITKDFSIT